MNKIKLLIVQNYVEKRSGNRPDKEYIKTENNKRFAISEDITQPPALEVIVLTLPEYKKNGFVYGSEGWESIMHERTQYMVKIG